MTSYLSENDLFKKEKEILDIILKREVLYILF